LRRRITAGKAALPKAARLYHCGDRAASVNAAETGGKPRRGYDAGKKINGRKRRIAVDTLGLLLCVLVTAASVLDRDGAMPCSKPHHLISAHPRGMSRRRLCRQARVLDSRACSPTVTDRRRILRHQRIRGPAPALGRRTNIGLTCPVPPMCPRRRTPSPPPRRHGPLEHDRIISQRLAQRV
jgi:hypothetical protein